VDVETLGGFLKRAYSEQQKKLARRAPNAAASPAPHVAGSLEAERAQVTALYEELLEEAEARAEARENETLLDSALLEAMGGLPAVFTKRREEGGNRTLVDMGGVVVWCVAGDSSW